MTYSEAQSGVDTSAYVGAKVQYSLWQVVCAVCAIVLAAGAMVMWSQLSHRDAQFPRQVLHTLGTLNIQKQSLGLVTGPWLAGVRQTLPTLQRYPQQGIAEAIPRVTGLLTQLESGAPRSEVIVQLQQEMLVLEKNLLTLAQQRDQHYLDLTHYYYWTLLGCFVCLMMLRRGPKKAGQTSDTLSSLLSDTYLQPNLPVPLALADPEGHLLRVNDAYAQLHHRPAGELLGSPQGSNRQILEALQTGRQWRGDYSIRLPDGSSVTETLHRLVVGTPEQPQGYVSLFPEWHASAADHRLMLWQAHHDNLTKLPNANQLHERMAQGLVELQEQKKTGALISIDLDCFQQVNDSVGHELADRILTEAAYRIAVCARDNDTVARVGGDIFAIALFDIEHREQVGRIAEAAVESVTTPFQVEGHEIYLTASAGVVLFPVDGLDTGELLQKADAARLQAKKQGGGQVAFFEEKINQAAARRLDVITQLRQAIEQDEFQLHYQPIVSCQNGQVSSAEALLRWHNPALGMVSPAEFIPLAEETGLIVAIGETVVRQVVSDLQEWSAMPQWRPMRVSINVSAHQFVTEADAQTLIEILAAAPTELLTVELTESALIEGGAGAALFMRELKRLGVQIALDDFGTGYSSISYLKDFDFDVLKIDKSFIDGITSSKELGLVAAIISTGRIMGMKIVAEGVEEETQVNHLRRLGCDYIQGYFFSKPLAPEDFLRYLDEQAVA